MTVIQWWDPHIAILVQDQNKNEDWYSCGIMELVASLGTHVETGLSMNSASERMKRLGSNRIPQPLACPEFMCCLLPCIKNTNAMILYRQCLPDSAKLVRGGRNLCIDATSVVPGDILYIGRNDIVPADCRIISVSEELKIEPFGMQGVVLHPTGTPNPNCKSLLDANNVLLMGSLVFSGKAIAVAVHVGNETLMSKLIQAGMWPPQKREISENTAFLSV